jgi:MSHA pilin protein MshD
MSTDAPSSLRARGFTLVEVVMFIIIVVVALGVVLLALNKGAMFSASPMIRKQALAAAESLLEEILLQPFTYCDPRDASAPTATSSAGCSAGAFSMDSPANWGSGKTRYGPVFFNNVADYHNFAMNGTLNDLFQQSSTRLTGYSASVTVTQVGATITPPNTGDVLRIDVTVSGSGDTVTLTGFRFRHSPNMAN